MKVKMSGGMLIGGVVGLMAALLALNSFIIVQDGTKETEKFLGEISDTVYDAGFHFVNPFSNFERWDVKEQMKTVHITIPSQDKFKSGATLTVKWDMGDSNLPEMQRTVGLQHAVESLVLTKPLDSILRSAGRQVPKAQDLFSEDVVAKVQSFVLDGLRDQANPYGIQITEVFISDITLDKVIQNAITRTKELEEQEAQELARLEQQKLIYARQTAEAEAKALSAAHQKAAAKEIADAKFYASKLDADAVLYAAQQEAAGNKALSASVDNKLLALKDAEAKLITASRWTGQVPTTMMGGDAASVVPLYHMNK